MAPTFQNTGELFSYVRLLEKIFWFLLKQEDIQNDEQMKEKAKYYGEGYLPAWEEEIYYVFQLPMSFPPKVSWPKGIRNRHLYDKIWPETRWMHSMNQANEHYREMCEALEKCLLEEFKIQERLDAYVSPCENFLKRFEQYLQQRFEQYLQQPTLN